MLARNRLFACVADSAVFLGLAEFVLQAFSCGDVVRYALYGDHFSRLVVHSAVGDFTPNGRTVFAARLDFHIVRFELPVGTGRRRVFLESRQHCRKRGGRHYLGQRKLLVLLRRKSKNPLHRRTDVCDSSGEVGRPDDVAHIFREQSMAPLADAQRFGRSTIVDGFRGDFRQVLQKRGILFRKRMLGEHRQHAGRLSIHVVEFVAGERNQAKLFRPFVVLDLRVRCDVIGVPAFLGAAGYAPDLIMAERNPLIPAVGVLVSARTGHQMETFVGMFTDFLTSGQIGTSAIAEIARSNYPNAAEIEIEHPHGRVGGFFELVFQRSRRKKLLLQTVHLFESQDRLLLALNGQFYWGYIPPFGDQIKHGPVVVLDRFNG